MVEEGMPAHIREQLTQIATRVNTLGDTVGGEGTLDVVGSRAQRELRRVQLQGYTIVNAESYAAKPTSAPKMEGTPSYYASREITDHNPTPNFTALNIK